MCYYFGQEIVCIEMFVDQCDEQVVGLYCVVVGCYVQDGCVGACQMGVCYLGSGVGGVYYYGWGDYVFILWVVSVRCICF